MKQRRGIWLIVGIVVVGFILAVVIAVVAAVILGSQVTAQEPSPVPSVAVTATSLSETPTEQAETVSPPTTVVEPTVEPVATVEVVPTEVPGDGIVMTIVEVELDESMDTVAIQFTFPFPYIPETPQVWANGRRLYGIGMCLDKSDHMLDHFDQLRAYIDIVGAGDSIAWELRWQDEVVAQCAIYRFWEYPTGHELVGDCIWPLPEK